MKKKILILAGGFSKENVISLKTAKGVNKALKKKRYLTKICEPDGNLIKILKNFKPHVVFNALHGRYGEDGYIQALLETEKIKYTHSGVLSSSIAIDKDISKKIFINNRILTPKYFKFRFIEKIKKKKLIQKIKKNFGFPVVIKPINEGSSVEVYICNKKNLIKNLIKLKPYKEIIIEKYIPGREIQVAILGNKKLGAIELIPKRKFYDYKAKYSANAKTKYIIPVKIDKINMDEIYSQSSLLIRLTKHDGFSSMVLEALSYGRNIIWTYDIPNVKHIKLDRDNLFDIIDEVKKYGYNLQGENWVKKNFNFSSFINNLEALYKNPKMKIDVVNY